MATVHDCIISSLVQRVTGPKVINQNILVAPFIPSKKKAVISNDNGRLRLLLSVNPNIFKRMGLTMREQVSNLCSHDKVLVFLLLLSTL